MSFHDALFGLPDRIVVVTGAGRGLGAEIAVAVAGAGAHVACLSLDHARAEKTAEAVRRYGREAIAVVCDVADENSVRTAFEAVVAEFGRVDILYNNAGIADPAPAPLHETDSAHWDRTLGVNLSGAFYCCKAALKVMVAQGRGKIINVASIWGMAGAASVITAPAYSATKGALVNLTRELALEYAHAGIQVNALCPGFHRTDLAAYQDPEFVAAATAFTPMGRIADAAEIRGPALFLAAPASDYMTGQTLVVDGGCLAK
ncbi:glucose 1-dehydrogenase [Actinomadura sp. KC216]|uniref:SDR family NAD(P)-dependent oxidoreductase n=1 Tax=Actinomadura sp. KC216 TaxID=2530370 RepID=UPI00104BD530|nr:glucose 1-dehydrogenase [Actinomadura sp. KC216]TDB91923.1 glucose 1-dehydrogenase [Actinomadura sp. KC216]